MVRTPRLLPSNLDIRVEKSVCRMLVTLIVKPSVEIVDQAKRVVRWLVCMYAVKYSVSHRHNVFFSNPFSSRCVYHVVYRCQWK